MAAKIKKGDQVIVLAGRDKGSKGQVLRVVREDNKAFVSGVNVVKRHQKASGNQQAGIITKEAAIDLSNLALLDPKDGVPAKIGFKINNDGKKVRYSKKSGELIDG
jgi:large subunit ribosomal protein L24